MSAPDDPRTRLSKILPLLSSDKQGERDAAALAAQRILTKAGLSWGDIIAPTPVPHRAPPWRATCLELQKRPGSLRRWEIGFVASLPAFHRISEKQRNILNEIARRVLGGAA
jgi:hypothetical protein